MEKNTSYNCPPRCNKCTKLHPKGQPCEPAIIKLSAFPKIVQDVLRTASQNLKQPEVFVLMEDDSGTTFSQATPFGIAVDTEEEAKAFVKEATIGYSRSYEKVRIFGTFKDGLAWRFPTGTNNAPNFPTFCQECGHFHMPDKPHLIEKKQ